MRCTDKEIETMNTRMAMAGLALLLALPAGALAQYTWTGNNNNNWDNNSNWTGQSGYPDDPADNVVFTDSPNRFSVDLRGGDRDVGNMSFSAIGANHYSFESNNGGTGILRINGNLKADSGDSTLNSSVTFNSDVNLLQAADSTWNLGAVKFNMDANLGGSASIDFVRGTLRLYAANDFSGNMHITAPATVELHHANALANALVTLDRPDNGLDLTSVDASLGALAGTGRLDVGSTTLTVGSIDLDTTYSGNLRGTGNLVKLGRGDWTLSGNNTFTGTVTLGDGILTLGSITIGSDNALINNTVIVKTVDGLNMGGADRTIGGLGGGGVVNLTDRLSVGNNNTDTTFGGAFDGAGSLMKIGTGTLTLTGHSSFTGGTVCADGVLQIRADYNLGDVAGNVTFDGGQLTVDRSISMARDFDFASALSTGALGVTDGNTARLDGSLTGLGAGSAFTKSGPGTLTLRGAATNTGAWLNTSSGILNVAGGADMDSLEAASGEVNLGTNAVNLQGDGTNVLFCHGSGAVNIDNGAVVTLTGTGGSNRTVLTGDARLTIQDSGSTLVTPRLDIGPSGTGSAVVEVGSGGGIEAGRVQVGDLGADTGAAGTLTIASGGEVVADQIVLYRRGSIAISDGGTLATDTLFDGDSASHPISISDPSAGSALTVGVSDGSSSVATLIEDAAAGAGSLNKIGAGTLELTQANTYSGGTIIDGGTLRAGNTSGSATGTGGVVVNASGTLGGNGSVAGTTIVQSGGTIAPGASTGELSLSNATFKAGSTLAIELAGVSDFDHLRVDGTATLGGTLDLSYLSGFTASPGDSFIVLSAAPVIHRFDAVNFPDGQAWTIDYDRSLGTVTVSVGCADADSDGVCDANDICPGFDDTLDADTDGIPDGCDGCPSSPNVYNVTQHAHYPTIQAAIDASTDGDVIQLGACTFHEDNITLLGGKSLTLRGAGMDQTTLDGGNDDTDPAIRIDADQVTTASLSGFSITNSNSNAIRIVNGDVSLDSVRFQNCTGAPALSSDTQVYLKKCIFTGNSGAFASAHFGGFQAILLQCLFHDNTTTFAIDSTASIGFLAVNCTIPMANSGTIHGSGGPVGAVNCILGAEMDVDSGVETDMINNLYPGATGDNIPGMAEFVDAANGDYRLAPGSLGIDAADFGHYDFFSYSDPTDLAGNPRTHDDPGTMDTGSGNPTYLDIGAFEFQGTTTCGAGGDLGNDGDVDRYDYGHFAICMNGPTGGLDPNCGCLDLDADGDVDLRDYAAFQINFTGPQ